MNKKCFLFIFVLWFGLSSLWAVKPKVVASIVNKGSPMRAELCNDPQLELTDVLVMNRAPIQLGVWNTTTSFNTPRSAHTSVAYNGYLYVIGGESGDGSRLNDVQYAPINADGSLGNWQSTTPFNTGRRSHASVVNNGYLYVIGGAPNGGGVLNDVQYAPINADGSLGNWLSTTSFNTGRLCHTSVVINGYLYVIQGFYYSAASPLTDVQFAKFNSDGSLGAWQSTTSFSPARFGHASIACNGYIYSMGGCNWNGNYYTLNDVQYSLINATGSLNNWQSTTPLDPSLNSPGLVAYNGYLVITGGGNIPNGYLNDVKSVKINSDGSLGAWQSLTSFNTGRAGHTSVVHNGYLYVIGGQDSDVNVLNNVQYAKFEQNYTVTFIETAGGKISGSKIQTVVSGGDTTPVQAVANNGHTFINWTGTGGFLSTANPLTVTNVIADLTITVHFSANNIVGNWSGLGVWCNNANSATWEKLCNDDAAQIVMADMDGNSIDDLVGWWNYSAPDKPHGIWVRYDNGQWANILPNPAGLKWITAGDIDGDGLDDFAGSFTYGMWWKNSKTRSWHKIHDTGAETITLGDFDGDGKADLAGYWKVPEGLWIWCSGTNKWENLIGTAGIKFLTAGDINGDGRMDIAGSWEFGVWWYDFVSEVWDKLDNRETLAMACGDINGSGKDDLIGVWKGIPGLWVRYSETGSWEKLHDVSPTWVTTGKQK